jgi:Domain of unknown function (DUF3806)
MSFGQSGDDPAVTPTFSELSHQDSERLNQQRATIGAVVKQRYGRLTLSKTGQDLPTLQRLIDDGVFKKTQTYELQSLGVVFGDILASELPLRWVMITDEYGTDPTLRYKNSSININALTMISKRVEKNEQVDLYRLLEQNREALSEAQRKSR